MYWSPLLPLHVSPKDLNEGHAGHRGWEPDGCPFSPLDQVAGRCVRPSAGLGGICRLPAGFLRVGEPGRGAKTAGDRWNLSGLSRVGCVLPTRPLLRRGVPFPPLPFSVAGPSGAARQRFGAEHHGRRADFQDSLRFLHGPRRQRGHAQFPQHAAECALCARVWRDNDCARINHSLFLSRCWLAAVARSCFAGR